MAKLTKEEAASLKGWILSDDGGYVFGYLKHYEHDDGTPWTDEEVDAHVELVVAATEKLKRIIEENTE